MEVRAVTDTYVVEEAKMEFINEIFKKIRGLIIFTAVIVLVFWNPEIAISMVSNAFGVVLPFIIGGAIAFVLNVPMSFIEERIFSDKVVAKRPRLEKAGRPLSLFLVIIVLTSILLVVLFVLIPQLITSTNSLLESAQVFLVDVEKYAAEVFNNNKQVEEFLKGLEINEAAIMNYAVNFLQSGVGNVFDTTLSAAMGFFSAITTGFIAFVFAVYILLQKEMLAIHCKKVLYAFIPENRAGAVKEIAALTYRTFANFLAGQCLEAVILGSMFVIVLTIFGIPFALLIGIVIAITALIPMFGAFIGCFIGAFFIFIENPAQALVFIIIFLVLQQVEGNLVYPHVVGNSVGLPSIWVLVAVSIGGTLMGVVGMLIFIPITSVVYTLFREVVYLKLKKNKIDPKDIEVNKL